MSDETEKTHEEKISEALEGQIALAWKGLIAQPAGRLILWSILDKCGVADFPFFGNSTDALLRGRQQIGAEILEEYVYPHGMGAYTDMILEAEERQNRINEAIQQDENEETEDASE